jgi:hypothetical protein
MDRNHSLPQLTNTAEFVESEGGKLKKFDGALRIERLRATLQDCLARLKEKPAATENET